MSTLMDTGLGVTTKSREKSKELSDSEVFKQFESATQISLGDAIRAGSTNTEQAKGWGDGENMCALHAAMSASKAFSS